MARHSVLSQPLYTGFLRFTISATELTHPILLVTV